MSLNDKITDHAVIRYLQRVKGIDIESIKDEMVNSRTLNQLPTLNQEKAFHIKREGYDMVVKGGKIVTVITPTERDS